MHFRLGPIVLAFLFVGCLICSFNPTTGWGQTGVDEESEEMPSNFRVVEDEDAMTTEIVILATDGSVAWSDVLKGLARAGRLDEEALDRLLPDGALQLDSPACQITLLAVNLSLAPGIKMDVVRSDLPGEERALRILINRRELIERRRAAKEILSQTFGGLTDRNPERFGLRLTEDWAEAVDKPLVIVVHGFQSSDKSVGGLVKTLVDQGLPCGTFAYPNDQRITYSAKGFSDVLKQLAEKHPDRQVTLLTHSMGGLVSREMIENPDLDPGNVGRIVMVAPPSHGSALAKFGFAADIWEFSPLNARRASMKTFYASVEDGLSEGSVDLVPGSTFLKTLNARPRNAKVKYSMLLGTDGFLTQEELDSMKEDLATARTESAVIKLIAPRIDEILSDMDEVIVGKGDGVVSVERGKLEGVPDTKVLSFRHGAVTDPQFAEIDDELLEAILSRVRKP